jgi:hypothetical protein
MDHAVKRLGEIQLRLPSNAGKAGHEQDEAPAELAFRLARDAARYNQS